MKGLIFTYLLTYGGAAISLYRPFYGLLVYVCFAIIKPESMWYWSVPAGNYSRIVAIGLLVGWAANGFGQLRMGRGKAFAICLVGFLFWGLLSTLIMSVVPDRSFRHLESLGKIVLPFVVGVTLIENIQQAKQLA